MTKKFEPQLKVVQIGDAYVSEVLDEYKVELDLGVEIYEGDILKNIGISDKPLVVHWLNDNACFDASGYRIDLVAKHGVIIGNIFENSELLEGN